MSETNNIDKAIEYLQSLKKRDAIVDEMVIEYGVRIATPADKNYCEFASFEVHDGTFVITIQGSNLKQT